MNTKTVRELRSIAKNKGLYGYYKLKKDELVALLLQKLAEEMPKPALRSKGKKRRPVALVKIIPSPQEIKNAASKVFSKVKNSMLELHDSAKKTLKGYVEGEARKENQAEEEEDADLTPHEHERALKGAYRSFVIPGTPKAEIDSYFDQTKPRINKNQLKEMRSARIIITLWVIWKKAVRLLIGPEDLEDAQDTGGNDKGRSVPFVSPSPHEMDEFEKDEMKNSRSLVKNKLNGWYDWLINHIPKPIKNAASKEFLGLKNSILKLYDGVKKTLNGQREDNTVHENEDGNGYIRIEITFNSMMTEFFEGSDIDDLI